MHLCAPHQHERCRLNEMYEAGIFRRAIGGHAQLAHGSAARMVESKACCAAIAQAARASEAR